MVDRKKAEKKLSELFDVKEKYIMMNKFSPTPFTDKLREHYSFVYDKNKVFWMYDEEEGIWVSGIEQRIKSIIRTKLFGDMQQKKNYVDEVISHLKDISYDEEFTVNKYPYLIAFNNKVYDLKDKRFIDFSKELYISNKIKINIDENITECPKIDNFFIDCVSEEYKQMLYDLIAYTLYPKYPYQKLFFIYGSAGTGKSQFMSLIEKFLGENNRCAVDPQYVENDQYSTQLMKGKLANVSSDIKHDAIKDITMTKKLTGGDTVRIREMYKNPYDTKLYCKQIYSTNKLPTVKEKTRAWYRRVYLIPFYNIVNSDKVDSEIIDKLTTEKELQGLAYKCLKTLQDLYDNNFIFSYDIDVNEMQKLYEELSNPIMMFINENCEIKEGIYCYDWEFKERLNVWLKDNHFPTLTRSQINEYMREHYNDSNRDSPDKTKKWRVWVGFNFKKFAQSTSFNHFNHFNQSLKKVYIWKRSFQTPLNPLNPLNEEGDV